jgi:NTE family protein
MRALVLSGGGMFGAWQAGAWSVLAPVFSPDLIVGCSVGALNGYAIASGVTAPDLCELWRTARRASLRNLDGTLRELTRRPLERPFAVAVVDLPRLKPRICRDAEITWRHLAASCALPPVRPPVRIGGRWVIDGGLLNPLPVWAAVELGATHVLAMNVFAEFPVRWMRPAVAVFRWMFGHHPPLAAGVAVTALDPGRRLGGLHDSLVWKQENIGRWLDQGAEEARQAIATKSFQL